MRLNTLTTLFTLLLLVCAEQLLAQKAVTRMYTEKDDAGIVNNAMLYIDNEPLNVIVSQKKLINIKAEDTYLDVIHYLNSSLNINLEANLETAIVFERIGDYLYEADKNKNATYSYYKASAGLLQHLGYADREAYMDYYIGALCFEMKNKKESDLWFQKMVAIKELNTDEDQSEYAKYLITAIDNFYSDKNYNSSAFYLEKYLNLGERSKATNALKGQACLMLGDSYWNLNRKDEALTVYQLAIPFIELAYGKDSETYRLKVPPIAKMLSDEGKKAEAIIIYEQLFKVVDDFDFSNKLEICSELLGYYNENFQFDPMIPVLEKLKEIVSANQWMGSKVYLNLNDAAAFAAHRSGRYEMAEKLFLESIEFRQKNFSEAETGRGWLNLAPVYLKMYNPDQAINCAEKGYAMLSHKGRPDRSDERYYQGIMGVAFMSKGAYDDAEKCLKRSLELQQRDGLHAIDYANTINMLGVNYWYKKEYDNAEKSFMEAYGYFNLEQYRKLHEFGTLNANLALLYGSRKDYVKAVDYTQKALDIIAQADGKLHADYLIDLSNYSKYAEAAGNNTAAYEYILQSNDLLRQIIDKNLLYWSAQEMELFISNHTYRFMDHFNSYYFRNAAEHPELTGMMYDNQLFMKGLLLSSAIKFQQAVNSIKDSAIIDLSAKIHANRSKLEVLYSQPVSDRTENAGLIEQQNILLQKELKSKIVDYIKTHDNQVALTLIDGLSYRDIGNNLATDEAAVEFAVFRYHDVVEETDSIFYTALIMRKDFKFPALVFLGTEKEISPQLKKHPDELYAPGDLSMYELLWKPVEKYLQGVSKVLYSPAGLLNRIAFAAIPAAEGGTISDHYKLYNVSSTRKILEKEKAIKPGNGYLFGGIDYNQAGEKTMLKNQDRPAADEGDTTVLRSLRGNSWQYLPGTLQEVNQINNILKVSSIKAISFTGPNANETIFKQLPDMNASVIHIASHGFSLAETGKLTGKNLPASNPLTRCGLLFAGANKTLLTSTSGNEGILTAFELSNLDFKTVDLFVLSACETGLGEIKGSEGVYGLQRALFMSGAGSIVVSLWEVPDLETSELMALFYSEIAKGFDPENAFYAAQQQMKRRYPDQPSLWAGFIFCR